MRFRYFFLLISLLAIFPLAAQPPETIYPGNVAQDGYADDELYGPFNIGFTFTYYGNPYTQFYVSSNGLVLFSSVPFSTNPLDPAYIPNRSGVAVDIPNSTLPDNYIAPFWDELVIDSYGKILYTTIGAASNQKCIIQFKNMGFYPAPATLGTFSVILYEATNTIQIQYRLIVLSYSGKAHGGNATIGLENSDGTSGVKYAFHNPSAVNTEQAISFSPIAGPSYSVNSDAVYDGVYLTTNESLPEPGITNLISPPQDAIIGADATFEWSSAPNAESYTLFIGTDPDLIGATPYLAGTNLTYDITGLTLDETYYWGVFSKNTTGTTWCEITRFTTSTFPPLTPVPQTIWAEKPLDKTIQLQYTGGDTSPKTAIITTLPGHGQLYQYNAGARGSLISTVPTAVTDADMKIIYAATGDTGNGVGNFNFKLNDGGGDSPEGTITINVSPPGVPNVLYFARSSNVEIQFDIIMADPTGKESQFIVKNDGTPLTIYSATLKEGDPYTIVLTLATPPSGTVLISYSPGDITGSTGGLLLPFTDLPVTLTAQTITFSQSLTKKYSDSPFALTATSSSGLGVTYSSSDLTVVTISSNVATFHALGTSELTARQEGDATFAPTKYIRTLTVAIGDQSITFNPLPDKVFGEDDFPPGATASSGLPVTYMSDNTSVATIVSGMIHIVGAGSAVITASQSGNSLWNPATDVPRTLIVKNANATVSLGGLSTTYNGLPQAVTATTVPAGLTVDFTYDGSAEIPTDAGTYAVFATINDPDYQGFAEGTLIISKANLSATADDKNKIYGDENPALTVTYTGFVGTDDETVLDVMATVTTVALQYTDVGIYAITPSGGSDNNYTFSYTDGTLTIDMAALMVTADDKNKTYGDVNPQLTVSYAGFLGTDDETVLDVMATVTTVALQYDDVGTYAIVPSGGSDNNYTFSYTDGSLTINKAELMVIADDKTKTYGDVNPPLSITYSGFTGTDDETVLDVMATVTTVAIQYTDAGIYAIVAAGGSDNNYTFNYSDGILTINKADQSITFGVLSNKTYGDADFDPAATASSALSVTYTSGNTDVATIVSGNINITGAGTAIITASQAGDINYNPATDVPQTLTVNKADLTFTADDKTKFYQEPNPVLTYTITGFVNGENESVLDVLPTIQTTAAQNTPYGDYPISFTGGSDNNYSFIFVQGTLSITKISQIITISDFPEKLLIGDSYTLVASSSSGLPVLFESMNTSLATIVMDRVTGVSKGDVQIRAYHPGDAIYDPAEAFVTIEIYSTHKDIMYLFTPNNDGFNDQWELPDLVVWGKCDVRVFNRWGKLVFSDPDYNNLWEGTSNGSPLPEGPYYFIIKTENAGSIKGTLNIVR